MPWIPLIIVEKMIIKVSVIGVLILKESIIIGAIFCHVSNIRTLFQVRPLTTSGTQKWNGAAPIFIKNAVFNISEKDSLKWAFSMISSFELKNAIENKISVEAKAWIIKYFIIDSAGYLLW